MYSVMTPHAVDSEYRGEVDYENHRLTADEIAGNARGVLNDYERKTHHF